MNKTKKIKIIFLFISKWCGLFRLAKHFTKNGLRILCYHNFSFTDEINWRPKLFMRPDIFSKRMDFLEQENIPVLDLNRAVKLLFLNKLPPMATVITMDDGWYSNKLYAKNILSEKSYPWTIYLTSYYCIKETPIFSLVIAYMFWKTKKKHLNLDNTDMPFKGEFKISDSIDIMNEIINYGQTKLDNNERCKLAKRIGQLLEVSYDEIVEKRCLTLMKASEIKKLADSGVNIQIHTHRHKWPEKSKIIVEEINENRCFIEMITQKKANHLCYPSGIWQPEHFSCLTTLDIKSATTCEPGINYSDTEKYLLCRFLDGNDVHSIEFEAEIFGYLEILRRIRRFLTHYFMKKSRQDYAK